MKNLSRLEEEFLVCEALGIDKTELVSRPQLLESNDPKLKEFRSRKEKHEPLAYITGYQPFFGLKIFVNQNVLIPRPETELLVEAVTNFCSNIDSRISILDIGTGSGAIAVSLAKNIPHTKIIATDISIRALNIAQKNAEYNNVLSQIKFMQGDLFSPVSGKKFDVIVSNPPYIPTNEIKTLQPEVKDFEPRAALDGGDDGLDVIRRIASEAKNYLNPKGYLIFEFGFGQSAEIKKLLKKNGYSNIRILNDYAKAD